MTSTKGSIFQSCIAGKHNDKCVSLKFFRESRIKSCLKTSIYMENICNSGVVAGVGMQEF